MPPAADPKIAHPDLSEGLAHYVWRWVVARCRMVLALIMAWSERRIMAPLAARLAEEVQWRTVGPLSERIEELEHKIDLLNDAAAPTADWQQAVLDDFYGWVTQLDALPAVDESLSGADLTALLTELTGLRQEVRAQSRQQSRTLATLEEAVKTRDSEAANLAHRLDQLGALLDQYRAQQIILPFLDVRDALERGFSGARDLAATRSLFKKRQNQALGVVEGYQIALRRFDRALAQVDVHKIDTLGQPFDPHRMRAVGVRPVPGCAGSIVTEEHLSGFRRGDTVIRTAEVIVSA